MGKRRTTEWTCTRRQNGVECRAKNSHRVTYCRSCGKAKPKKKRPEHLSALDYDYDWYIDFNGGEHCGVCIGLGILRGPSEDRKLDRDHNHKTHAPRGLLCPNHNRVLWDAPDDVALAEAILAYLVRARKRWNEMQ